MYYVCDSDGNPVGERCDNVDEAIRLAAETVIEVWGDYERATVAWEPERAEESPCEIATVERAGPKGCRTVRIALAGAGWVAMTHTFGAFR